MRVTSSKGMFMRWTPVIKGVILFLNSPTVLQKLLSVPPNLKANNFSFFCGQFLWAALTAFVKFQGFDLCDLLEENYLAKRRMSLLAALMGWNPEETNNKAFCVDLLTHPRLSALHLDLRRRCHYWLMYISKRLWSADRNTWTAEGRNPLSNSRKFFRLCFTSPEQDLWLQVSRKLLANCF